MEKNKDKQDSGYQNTEELQIHQAVETGRKEIDHIQQRQQTHNHQQQLIQEEWHTQKKRNQTQQVRFNADRVVTQQFQAQTSIIPISTKNTYIDLEVQEFTTDGGRVEDHIVQEHRHHIVPLNRPPQIHIYNTRVYEHRDQSKKQQRSDVQVFRKEQTGDQQDTITRPGIDSMLPSPAAFNVIDCTGIAVDNVGVVVGGVREVVRRHLDLNYLDFLKEKVKLVNRGL